MFGCCMPWMASGCSSDPAQPDQETAPTDTVVLAPADIVVPFEFEGDDDPILASLPAVDDELLVRPFPGADPDELDAAYVAAEAEVITRLPEIQIVSLRVRSDDLSSSAKKLKDGGLIEFIARNHIYEPSRTPNDPQHQSQLHLTAIRAPFA